MPSAPSYDGRQKRKHKRRITKHKLQKQRHEKKVRQVPRWPVPTGQSWFGSGSLILGLLGLFILTVNGILIFQSQHGAPGTMRLFIEWVSRLELLLAIGAIVLGLLSFPFSSQRQRNAVLGVLAGFTVLGLWIYLANWKPLL